MITDTQAAWLNLIIALSIGVSPLLMKAQDWAQVRFFCRSEEPSADTHMDHNGVIIAGFGRFGQIVGRLLLANGIGTTVLDHDSEHIANMRQFGFKIFYGDATRLDLLEIAGAHQAKILVVAVDDQETINKIVSVAKKHFPNLHVLARAKDVQHMYTLQKLGADSVQRELFESSLLIGRSALEHLGRGRYEAKELADRFRRTNNTLIEKMAGLRDKTPAKEFAKASRAGREELERQLQAEANHPQLNDEWQAAKARSMSS